MLSFLEYIEEDAKSMAAMEAKRRAELANHNMKVQTDVLKDAHKEQIKLKKEQIKKKLEYKERAKDPDKFEKKQQKKKYNEIKKRIGIV